MGLGFIPTRLPKLALKLSIDLDSAGRIQSGSYAQAQLDGAISGDLLDFEIGTTSKSLMTLKRLALDAKKFVPAGQLATFLAEVAKAVLQRVFSFSLSARGEVTLGARLTLAEDSGGSLTVTPTAWGSFEMTVTGKAVLDLQLLDPIEFGLPDFFTDLLKIEKKTWGPPPK